jgi:RNA recognition motif-containing protein
MGKELYVGSLSYDTTEYDLEKLFSVSGRVTSIHLITDAKTGQFKGCGYVRMSSEAEAKDAINSLDGALLIDRKITVSMANPQKQQTGGYKGKFPAPKKPGSAAKGPGGKSFGKGPSSPKPAAKAGFKPASRPAPKKGGK